MFRYKQSSAVAPETPPPLRFTPSGSVGCGHGSLNCVASRSPDHLSGCCGGAQRSLPTGGFANGTPLNEFTPSFELPTTTPESTVTLTGAANALVVASIAPNTIVVPTLRMTPPSRMMIV